MSADNNSTGALAAAIGGLPDFTNIDLTRLRRKGVSHDHYAIGSRSLVARVPRLSQWDFDPATVIAYQEAAFTRAAPSGHTPKLHAVVRAQPTLPSGALIVDHIAGDTPALPRHMRAIAEALAAIHALPVPPARNRPPLNQADPLGATLARIEDQARHLPGAAIAPDARAQIEAEIAWARRFASDRPLAGIDPVLVGTDTHPGNFLIDRKGRAWFVDLEKAAYGNPAIDLAHASLPTSTGWDPDCAGAFSAGDVRAFYTHYGELAGPRRRDALRPWLVPMRRLTWLRTATWFARWRADFACSPAAPNDPAIRTHIERHIDACLDPAAIEAVRRQWSGPDRLSLHWIEE